MILFPRPLLKQLADAAEAAYPEECCGLLIGQRESPDALIVTRLAPSPNLAAGDHHDTFEVDPQLRFNLMRELEDGPERLIGHYHSHPDHAAQPSARDLAMAWEPDLVWVIITVEQGQAVHTTAHVVDPDGRQFREITLRTTDWKPYPVRGDVTEGRETP